MKIYFFHLRWKRNTFSSVIIHTLYIKRLLRVFSRRWRVTLKGTFSCLPNNFISCGPHLRVELTTNNCITARAYFNIHSPLFNGNRRNSQKPISYFQLSLIHTLRYIVLRQRELKYPKKRIQNDGFWTTQQTKTESVYVTLCNNVNRAWSEF